MKIALNAALGCFLFGMLGALPAIADPSPAGPLSVSGELICKLGKSGTENVVVSGKITGIDAQTRVVETKGLGYVFAILNPPIYTTDSNLQNLNIPCSVGQAAINLASTAFCGLGSLSSLSLDPNLLNSPIILNLANNLAGTSTKTTSLAMNDGRILHQWNMFCNGSISAPQ